MKREAYETSGIDSKPTAGRRSQVTEQLDRQARACELLKKAATALADRIKSTLRSNPSDDKAEKGAEVEKADANFVVLAFQLHRNNDVIESVERLIRQLTDRCEL